MSSTTEVAVSHIPTVYFIDDSATMREVIRIAFRRENFKIIACADAATALSQFEQDPPDAVITDVIMPDKDGYEVCQFVKQHPQFNLKPVILMSGIVNRTVAEKAMEVRADELIRKPFQPQELIARVKNLLHLEQTTPAGATTPAANPLTNIFAGAPDSSSSRGATPHGNSSAVPGEARRAVSATSAHANAQPESAPQAARAEALSHETQKLKREIARLDMLVKRLQAGLEAERQYSAALEAHVKTLQESE
jgi:DNA-binding response OmpR family regulator